MNPILRDIVICVATAIASWLFLIAPLFSLMILTGGAVFAIAILLVFLGTGLFVDIVAVRRGGTRGWPLTAAGVGPSLSTTFGVVTAWGTVP